MIVIIDNYDSFVHNLARYVREAGARTMIIRNDAASVEAILALRPAGIIISPGPKGPKDAGISVALIQSLPWKTAFLGVCLGHQCLVEAFGGRVERAVTALHGEASMIRHDGAGIFAGIENPTLAGRYHSLIGLLPNEVPLCVTATSAEGEIMAVAHQHAPWFGVQFHPESLLTTAGPLIIRNFLSIAARRIAA